MKKLLPMLFIFSFLFANDFEGKTVILQRVMMPPSLPILPLIDAQAHNKIFEKNVDYEKLEQDFKFVFEKMDELTMSKISEELSDVIVIEDGQDLPELKSFNNSLLFPSTDTTENVFYKGGSSLYYKYPIDTTNQYYIDDEKDKDFNQRYLSEIQKSLVANTIIIVNYDLMLTTGGFGITAGALPYVSVIVYKKGSDDVEIFKTKTRIGASGKTKDFEHYREAVEGKSFKRLNKKLDDVLENLVEYL